VKAAEQSEGRKPDPRSHSVATQKGKIAQRITVTMCKAGVRP